MVIKETENDDLTNVMQELIETYADQMGDVAISLCQELVRVVNYLLAESLPILVPIAYYRKYFEGQFFCEKCCTQRCSVKLCVYYSHTNWL